MKKVFLAVLLIMAIADVSFAATQQEVDAERRYLDQWLANKMRTCPDNTGCISGARTTHRNKMDMLTASPDAYFRKEAATQENRATDAAVRRAVRSEMSRY